MFGAAVVEYAPGFAVWVFDEMEMGDACILAQNLTASPWANVENMVKCDLYDSSVANDNDGLIIVILS